MQVSFEGTGSGPRDPDLAVCPASLSEAPASARRGGSYREPSSDEREALRSAFSAAVERRWPHAERAARHAAYRLCRRGSVVLALPRDPRAGHARLVLRPGPARPLIVQAPHPFHDSGTAEQARDLFRRLGARALILSGTHRCAQSSASARSARPGRVCGDGPDHAESDMAHNPDTFFQAAHEALTRLYPRATALSLHGMRQEGFSLSNGTRRPTEASAPVARLARELARLFPEEPVTTCNPHRGARVRYRLCGTTNSQGRFSNRHAQRSAVDPRRSTPRFIHLEQSPAVREHPDRTALALERWLDGV